MPSFLSLSLSPAHQDAFADETKGRSNRPKVVLGSSSAREKVLSLLSLCCLPPRRLLLIFLGVVQGKEFRLFHAKNVLRPQLLFKDPVDNSQAPWVPHPYRQSRQPSVSAPLDSPSLVLSTACISSLGEGTRACTGTAMSKEMEGHLVSQLGITPPTQPPAPMYVAPLCGVRPLLSLADALLPTRLCG